MILLTHLHGDHCYGVFGLSAKLFLPFGRLKAEVAHGGDRGAEGADAHRGARRVWPLRCGAIAVGR